MSAGTTTRGQPLRVLAIILGGWLVARVLLWAPPFPSPSAPSGVIAQADDVGSTAFEQQGAGGGRNAGKDETRAPTAPFPSHSWNFVQSASGTLSGPVGAPATAAVALVGGDLGHTLPRRAASHQMLLTAAFSHRQLPVPVSHKRPDMQPQPGYAATASGGLVADRPLLGTRTSAVEASPRISGDAWVLWRDGSGVAVTPGVPSYGRSQAGAVLRYRLFPRDSHSPVAYARATRTLEGQRQSELAAGLSLRPVSSIPVAVAAEARVTETSGGREVRPAAFAVTQIPPLALPAGLRGDVYLQAGYVGGNFETAFVDGQARIDRRLVQPREGEEVRFGLAVWGGAQKGAGRLDVGPSASFAFKLGEASSRIAVDYRLRVAGDAAPASGPAVTFSAGF